MGGMIRKAMEGKAEMAERRLEERAAAAGARASCGALHSVVRDAVAEEVARALLAAEEHKKQDKQQIEGQKEEEEEEEHEGGQQEEDQEGEQGGEGEANAAVAPTDTKMDCTLSSFASSAAPTDAVGKTDASGRAAAPAQVQQEDRLFSHLSSLVQQLLPASPDNHNENPEACADASHATASKEEGLSPEGMTGSQAEDGKATVAVRLDFGEAPGVDPCGSETGASASPPSQLQPSAAAPEGDKQACALNPPSPLAHSCDSYPRP